MPDAPMTTRGKGEPNRSTAPQPRIGALLALVLPALLLPACAHRPTPGPLVLPRSPGLHLLAPFEDVLGVPGSARLLESRLPELYPRLSGVTLGELAAANTEAYASARERLEALVARLNDRLALTRPVILLLLPGQLRAANPPETLGPGAVLFSDDDETNATTRILRGVALTHHELPSGGTLLADLIRAGVASRFTIAQLDGELLAGESPFVPYGAGEIASRLPHLVTLARHYPSEPRSSYGSGWIGREDLELLGWRATASLCNWDLWLATDADPADAICDTDTASEPTTLAAATLAALGNLSDAEPMTKENESGWLAHDFTLYLGGGYFSRRREVMLTYRYGVGLLRVKRQNLPGANHVIGRVAPALLRTLVTRLEALEVATMVDSYDAPLEDGSDYVFGMESDNLTVDFAFYGPCGGTDPRHCELHGLIVNLVDDVERAP